jgi:hypothetical protein
MCFPTYVWRLALFVVLETHDVTIHVKFLKSQKKARKGVSPCERLVYAKNNGMSPIFLVPQWLCIVLLLLG